MSLLFCLDPEDGSGWLNLDIEFTMGYGAVTALIGVLCPIIEADPTPPPDE